MMLAIAIVFHTVAGDLLFELDSAHAPETAAHFAALVEAGVYDGNAFTRVHPGFVIQVSNAHDRARPLTEKQLALLHAMPLENAEAKHARLSLSMIGESSFAILLGPAPQMDGKYTVFGRLRGGEDVLLAMLQVQRDAQYVPETRLTIERAEPYRNAPLAAARLLSQPAQPLVIAGIAAMLLLSLLGALFKNLARPLQLLTLLVAVFLLLAVALPSAQRHPPLAALLFFAVLAVFRALSQFEPAR